MDVLEMQQDRDVIYLDLASAVRHIIRGKWLLLLWTLAGLVCGLLIALSIKPYYYSVATFLPPANDVTNSPSALSLLNGSGGGDSSDMYLGLLGSRTVADDVIDHLNLMSRFGARYRYQAHNSLAKESTFSVNKLALILVSVKDTDPQLASAIANAYLAALYRINGQMTEEASAHRREFLDQQLQQQRDLLAKAEEELQATQERTGVVLPGSEAQAGVNVSAQLQSEIGAAEARLAGLLITDTSENPDVVQARSYLTQLRGQLTRQQAASGGAGITPTRKLAGLSLEYERKQRNVRLAEVGFNALLSQDERARLASIDPGPQLKIVDRAMPAEVKAGPDRKMITAYGMLTGLACGLIFLLGKRPAMRQFSRLSAKTSQ